MKRHHPIQTNDLVLSQRPSEKEWHLSVHLSLVQRGSSWLEGLSYFDLLLSLFTLALFITRVVHLDLLLPVIENHRCVLWLLSSLISHIHALLHKLVGVECLSYFHTQL